MEVQLHPFLTSALIQNNGQLRRLEAIFMQYICNPSGDRGSTVVKVLRYK